MASIFGIPTWATNNNWLKKYATSTPPAASTTPVDWQSMFGSTVAPSSAGLEGTGFANIYDGLFGQAPSAITASALGSAGAGTPSQSIFGDLANGIGGVSWGDIGSVLGGLGSLYQAYAQQQYQKEMGDLYKDYYNTQKSILQGQENRRAQAQANYEKSLLG